LEGNIGESLVLYPATIPMIFTLIFTALHIKFNFKHGADIIKISFIATALTVASFFIYKIITNKLI
jgi:hypothetical protein